MIMNALLSMFQCKGAKTYKKNRMSNKTRNNAKQKIFSMLSKYRQEAKKVNGLPNKSLKIRTKYSTVTMPSPPLPEAVCTNDMNDASNMEQYRAMNKLIKYNCTVW